MMVIAVAIGVVHLVMANLISRLAAPRVAGRARQGRLGADHARRLPARLQRFVGSGVARLVRQDLPGRGVPGRIALQQRAPPGRPRASRRTCCGWSTGRCSLRSISKAFGDTLSYLRLFALGLASAKLAVTFNGLAKDAAEVGAVGVLLALVILTIGHGVNFVLCLMSGVCPRAPLELHRVFQLEPHG